MANFSTSPNMSLVIPTVGQDPGPDWALNINASLTLIDQHNHTATHGVQVPSAGLNINADLSFNDNNLTMARSVNFQVQPTTLSLPTDLGCLYVTGVDLWYNDENGIPIRITSGGSVFATTSSLSAPPASASFSGGVLVVNENVNTPGNIQVGSVLIGDNTAGSNFTTISAAAALAANYTFTLPGALPGTSGAFITSDTSGNLGYTNVDNTTIRIVSNQLVVQPQNLGIVTEYEWKLNGPYALLTFPLTEIDGYAFFNQNVNIVAMWIYNNTAGSGGTTEFDIKVASPGGSFTSLLSTTGKITSAAAGPIWTDSNSAVAPQTGVTKPVIATAGITAGQAVRWDLLQSMTGAAADCGVIIQVVPA